MFQGLWFFSFLLLVFLLFGGGSLLHLDRSMHDKFVSPPNTSLFSALVELNSPIKTTDDRFLSVTLDTSIIRHDWAHFDTR